MSCLVSVILLSYNNLEYLESALKSVFIQDYPNIELIIADDGTDNFNYEYVNNLVYKLKKNMRDVYVYTNEFNEGTVKNFNKALKMCNGEIIMPLACDDEFYDENVVTAVSEEFLRKKCLICTAQRAIINKKNKIIEIRPNKKKAKKYFNASSKKMFSNICRNSIIFGACTYYSKKVFDEYGLFDERFKLLEDYPYYLDYIFKGGKIEFLDKIAIKYRTCGVTSKDNKSNSIFCKDFETLFEEKIMPRKKYIKRSIYRYWKYRYKRLKLKENKIDTVLNDFKFFDVFIMMVLKKIGRE